MMLSTWGYGKLKLTSARCTRRLGPEREVPDFGLPARSAEIFWHLSPWSTDFYVRTMKNRTFLTAFCIAILFIKSVYLKVDLLAIQLAMFRFTPRFSSHNFGLPSSWNSVLSVEFRFTTVVQVIRAPRRFRFTPAPQHRTIWITLLE